VSVQQHNILSIVSAQSEWHSVPEQWQTFSDMLA